MAFAPSPINPVPPSLSSRRCLNTTRSKHQTELQFSCPTPGRRKHLNGARIYGRASILARRVSTSALCRGAIGGAVAGVRAPHAVRCYWRRISIVWFSGVYTVAPAGTSRGGSPVVRPFLRRAEDVLQSRPVDRHRRGMGSAGSGAVTSATATLSSITHAARYAGGTRGLRSRCAQVLRGRPSGHHAGVGMSAGQSTED